MITPGILDPRTRYYVAPTRILWQSTGANAPENPERLLLPGTGQSSIWGEPGCMFANHDGSCGVLLDFGRELHGGLQIIVGRTHSGGPVQLRVRFGESASEAMGALPEGVTDTFSNDHAIHEQVVPVPWAGTAEIGNTGFRFARIDLVGNSGTAAEIQSVRAVFLFRDLPYLGSFVCSDERLNRIWETGAYTVHLNMQDHVWDGIKRDRLVWLGDMHPETMVISTVFGDADVARESLDLARDETKLPGYMNGMGSYSVWWLIIQRDWYLYHGNRAFLEDQRTYILGLLDLLEQQIDAKTDLQHLPNGFLDWPTSTDPEAVQAGLQALMVLGFQAGVELCRILGHPDRAEHCEQVIDRLKRPRTRPEGKKTAAAIQVLAGMMDAEETNRRILSADPLDGVSTFYGYYVLQARAAAADYQGCLDVIRQYWGAMLDLGATTFWEDFNMAWTENAAPIDELVPPGKVDVHAQYGDFCYKGWRHSLCHGWAGGPTAWLNEHVLGLKPLEPGCTVLRVDPHLGDLAWARGSLPTPLGVVSVSVVRRDDGGVDVSVDAPAGVRVVSNA